MRLADFYGAPRLALAKIGARRQAHLAASSTGRASVCLPFFQKRKSAAAATAAAMASAAAHAAETAGPAAAGTAKPTASRRTGSAESTAHGRPGSARRAGRMVMMMSHPEPESAAAGRRRRPVMRTAGSPGHQNAEKHHSYNDDYHNFHNPISFPSRMECSSRCRKYRDIPVPLKPGETPGKGRKGSQRPRPPPPPWLDPPPMPPKPPPPKLPPPKPPPMGGRGPRGPRGGGGGGM